MQPLTVYDIAIDQHERESAARQRAHLLTRLLRDRMVARQIRQAARARRRPTSTGAAGS